MNKTDTIVVFGVSADSSKYGYKIFKTLLDKGFSAYGINPKGGTVEGQAIYTQLRDVPAKAHTAIMVVPPAALTSAVQQCVEGGVQRIWFQPGAQSDAAFKLATSAGIEAVESCFMVDNGLW